MRQFTLSWTAPLSASSCRNTSTTRQRVRLAANHTLACALCLYGRQKWCCPIRNTGKITSGCLTPSPCPLPKEASVKGKAILPTFLSLFLWMCPVLAIAADPAASELERLPQPAASGGRPLMEVLRDRKSTREFSRAPIGRAIGQPVMGRFRRESTGDGATNGPIDDEPSLRRHLCSDTGRGLPL